MAKEKYAKRNCGLRALSWGCCMKISSAAICSKSVEIVSSLNQRECRDGPIYSWNVDVVAEVVKQKVANLHSAHATVRTTNSTHLLQDHHIRSSRHITTSQSYRHT